MRALTLATRRRCMDSTSCGGSVGGRAAGLRAGPESRGEPRVAERLSATQPPHVLPASISGQAASPQAPRCAAVLAWRLQAGGGREAHSAGSRAAVGPISEDLGTHDGHDGTHPTGVRRGRASAEDVICPLERLVVRGDLVGPRLHGPHAACRRGGGHWVSPKGRWGAGARASAASGTGHHPEAQQSDDVNVNCVYRLTEAVRCAAGASGRARGGGRPGEKHFQTLVASRASSWGSRRSYGGRGFLSS
jgi:hypothetical protein